MKRVFLLMLQLAVLLLSLPAQAAKQPASHTVLRYSDNLLREAQGGNAEAQYVLGRVYLSGFGVAQDQAEGYKWLQKSAAQGYAPGRMAVAECLNYGNGVGQDKVKAAQISAECMNDLKKMAGNGNGLAMTAMGNIYRRGLGVKQKHSEACKWYKKAAEVGDAEGMRRLGLLTENGEGTKKNAAEATQWYLKAAEAGDVLGMEYLALNHFYGIGTETNYPRAFEWFQKAAGLGDAESIYFIGKCYEEGKGVRADENTAFRYYKQAADMGHKASILCMGRAHRLGLGGYPVDREKALDIFVKAAQEGDSYAMLQAGDTFREACVFPKALEYYKMAAAADPNDKHLQGMVDATQQMINIIALRMARYAQVMDRVGGRNGGPYGYPDAYDDDYFQGRIKKNGQGYSFTVDRDYTVIGEAYGYSQRGYGVSGLTDGPTNELRGQVTKSAMTLTYYDDCMMESEYNTRSQPIAPDDPYNIEYECRTGSKTGEAAIFLKSEYLSQPDANGVVYSHFVMPANVTRTCKHGSRHFSLRGEGAASPYKFTHTMTVTFNFDEIARRNHISKEDAVMGLMSCILAITYPGDSMVWTMTLGEDICIFYALAKTFGITEEQWKDYVLRQYTVPDFKQADESKYHARLKG